MKKDIAWEKYVDPLGSNLEEVNFPGFDAEEDDDEDDYLANEQKNMMSPLIPHPMGPQKPGLFTIKPNKIMSTPFGFLTIDHHTLACEKFDFWIMHTNFDITEKIAETIEKVPGVETFDVLTRYRARIGFPRSPLFDTLATKGNIKRAVIETEDPREMTPLDVVVSDFDVETFNKIKMARLNLEGKVDNWAMLVLPNGNINIVTSDEHEDFKDKAEQLLVTKELVGGEFYSSAGPGV